MIAVPAGSNTQLIADYISEKLGVVFTPGEFQALAILDDSGAFAGAVAVSEYRGYDCKITALSEVPLAWHPRVCRAVFSYIFNDLGCVRCTALTKKSNKRARAFMEKMGFILEGCVRKGFDGTKDALIYGLLREDCTYIKDSINGTGIAESLQAPGEPEAGELSEPADAVRSGEADELAPGTGPEKPTELADFRELAPLLEEINTKAEKVTTEFW